MGGAHPGGLAAMVTAKCSVGRSVARATDGTGPRQARIDRDEAGAPKRSTSGRRQGQAPWSCDLESISRGMNMQKSVAARYASSRGACQKTPLASLDLQPGRPGTRSSSRVARPRSTRDDGIRSLVGEQGDVADVLLH